MAGYFSGLLNGPTLQSFADDGMRVNDAVADPAGRFWVTTMSYDAEPGSGCLHRLGTPASVLKGLTIPNGPAFSHDGKLSGRRTFLHAPNHTPDGMTTDVAGNVWIAFWAPRPSAHVRLSRWLGPEPPVRRRRQHPGPPGERVRAC